MNLTIFQHAKSNPRVGLKLDNANQNMLMFLGRVICKKITNNRFREKVSGTPNYYLHQNAPF